MIRPPSPAPSPGTGLVLQALRAGGLGPYDLQVPAGHCAVIMGASGAGKSRLLRWIADLDPHDGLASLDGQARASMAATAWRRRVTYVAAEPAWWDESVRAHLRDPARAAALLPALGLSPELLDAPVARLSTGERQRLALARSVHDEVRFLLLDEPSSALDPVNAARMEQAILDLKAAGVGIVLVTHHAQQARRLGDACYRLDAHSLARSA